MNRVDKGNSNIACIVMKVTVNCGVFEIIVPHWSLG